jgi:hypothetical protein
MRHDPLKQQQQQQQQQRFVGQRPRQQLLCGQTVKNGRDMEVPAMWPHFLMMQHLVMQMKCGKAVMLLLLLLLLLLLHLLGATSA